MKPIRLIAIILVAGCSEGSEDAYEADLYASDTSMNDAGSMADDVWSVERGTADILERESGDLADGSRADSFPGIDVPSPTYRSVPSYRPYSYGDNEEEDYREPFDEYEAERIAERELQREGYDYSYGCTMDCSGHEAGWQWRGDNGYVTPGNSQSFYEGTMAFEDALQDRVDEMRQDYEMGIDPY